MNTDSRWILKNKKVDLLIFYLPGIIGFLVAKLILNLEDHWFYVFLLWLALGVLDSGHVYSTLWRTYFSKDELSRRPLYYKLTPLLIFLVFFIWMKLGGLYLGLFVVYFTIYHNIRQFFGLSKWYQKINNQFDKVSDFFLYLLCVLPVIAFNFRDVDLPSYYSTKSIIKANPTLLGITLIVFNLSLLAYFSYEIFKYSKIKKVEWARILSVLYPCLLYSLAFIFSNSLVEILFPLVVSHGFSYLILIDYSLKKTKSNYTKKVLLQIFLIVIVFGSFEFFTEDFFFDVLDPKMALTTSIFLTPLFCHYLFDAFLWTKKHPESSLIIN